MFDLMGKLNEAQKQIEQVKEGLKSKTVTGTSAEGKIVVTANGIREVQNISIDAEWLKNADNEEVEDLMLVAVNRALEQSRDLEESELKSVAGGMLPGMGL